MIDDVMSKTLQRIAPLVVVLASFCSPAMAQEENLPDARFVGYPEKYNLERPTTATAWFALVGLGLIAAGPLFLNANRTHLD
mgnify:CR=1 FL=1